MSGASSSRRTRYEEAEEEVEARAPARPSGLRASVVAGDLEDYEEDYEEEEDEEDDGHEELIPEVPHCKYWLTTGRCPRPSCSYRHVQDPGERAALQARLAPGGSELLQRVDSVLRHAPAVQYLSRPERAELFVDWLVRELGLPHGSRVLDVAGGRGDVSFSLALRGIRATLVDPRLRPALSAQQVTRLVETASDAPPEQLCTFFDQDFVREYGRLLTEGTDAIVGMHPDQATEAIVDTAIAHRRPFAVVPCCVFPADFPHRRLPSGEHVQSLGQFIEYLRLKHPGIRQAALPYHDRNVVLYVIDYGEAPPRP